MSKLCFGGSFNPIHYGHLICAQVAAERAGFESVVLIPSAQSPHKGGAVDMIDGKRRTAMCRLAVQGIVGFEVNDIEQQRPGPSYTIETARELKRQGWKRICWLIGADMVQILPNWREPDALLREVDFVLMSRPGWSIDWDRLPAAYHKLKKNIVETPLIEISATDIRQRIGAGRSIDFLTPPAVVRYLHENGFYRGAEASQ